MFTPQRSARRIVWLPPRFELLSFGKSARGSCLHQVRNGCELLRQKIAELDRSGFGQTAYEEAEEVRLPPHVRIGGDRRVVKT